MKRNVTSARKSTTRNRQDRTATKESLIRFAIVGPASIYDAIIALGQDVFKRTGQKIHLHIDDVAVVSVNQVQDQADEMAPVQRQAKPAPRMRAVAAQLHGNGRNQVVYQVLDRRPVSGASKSVVHTFLVQRGALSAREIMNGTGLGQKAVESAVYGLKVAGVIQPVAVH